MVRSVVAALAAAFLVAAPAQAAQAPSALTVEHQAKPLAVESANPLLGWQVSADQAAYQLKIGTSADTLGDVYDSGKVDSSSNQNVAGPSLAANTRFYWTVRTWDAQGNASAYAPTAQP